MPSMLYSQVTVKIMTKSANFSAKGRVSQYIQNQPSSTSENGLTWSILNTGAYTEMLAGGLFVPTISPDGTRLFQFPLGNGQIPLMSLSDSAAFTVIMFESREEWSGKTLNIASQFATGKEIADTVARVAGVKAEYQPVTIEQWLAHFPYADRPMANMDPEGITMGQNFKMLWAMLEDDHLRPTRDMDALKKIHPGLQSLEEWIRETGYDGTPKPLFKRVY
jgi:hypothetical protein